MKEWFHFKKQYLINRVQYFPFLHTNPQVKTDLIVVDLMILWKLNSMYFSPEFCSFMHRTHLPPAI